MQINVSLYSIILIFSLTTFLNCKGVSNLKQLKYFNVAENQIQNIGLLRIHK